MMMKQTLLLFLLGCCCYSQAFVLLPQKAATKTRIVQVQASQPLSVSPSSPPSVEQTNFIKAWTALEARAEELKTNPNNDLEYNLVQKMLELVLDLVENAEADDFTSVMQAHRKLDKATRIEHDLEKVAHEVHDEVVDADGIIDTYQKNHLPEDGEMRCALAVSDIAHRVENHVERFLARVRATEEAARQQEDEAEMYLAELCDQEDEIRSTMEKLKALKGSSKQQLTP